MNRKINEISEMNQALQVKVREIVELLSLNDARIKSIEEKTRNITMKTAAEIAKIKSDEEKRIKADDIGTSCLGAEIDDLDQNGYMDFELSPVRESDLDKPTFEDGAELGLHGDDNDGF
ncbi:hypothetical protein CASFOL_042974 [Castilleja foliolosa]|uniref:Uncharacterized protein n=1 Tax=Castilleja foliolosa TaxID=1961234 RepID=A0ABD3B7P3_9LAMI